ncbi:MAG: NOL1/NOP2/sun family putative RNA methylase [Candidatus Woesearchaeota archaeon]
MEQIPWCKEGFWIEHKGKGEDQRRDIGNLVEHSLGYIYVQEASSMIPPIVLDPRPGELVLDMCASPGSKATQIAMYMENKGLLIANDTKGMRIAPLGVNIQKCGIINCIISLMEGRHFKGYEFDKILVDAPCSGTGTIRKSYKTIEMWNPNMVKKLSGIQRQLISTGFENLKKGGTLVYSTCSCEPEENEAVVSHLLDKYPDAEIEKISLKGLKTSESIAEFEGKRFNPEVKKCLRIWPQDNDTDGFFVCKIVKKKLK